MSVANDAKRLSQMGTCYYYFVCWSKKKDLASESIFEEVLKKISKRSPDSRSQSFFLCKF